MTPLVVLSVAQLGGVSMSSCFSIAGMDLLFFSCLLLGSQARGAAPSVAAFAAGTDHHYSAAHKPAHASLAAS